MALISQALLWNWLAYASVNKYLGEKIIQKPKYVSPHWATTYYVHF